jgi:hypothetical protein
MDAARALVPELRAATYETVIGLLATTGMFSPGHPLPRKPVFVFAQLRGRCRDASVRGRCGASTGCGASSVSCRGVELGHELTVGCAGCGQVLLPLLELQAQVDGLLLEMGGFLGEGVDVSWRAEPGFAPGLLAERAGQAVLELADAGGHPCRAFTGGEQVGLQRGAGDGRPGGAAGGGRGGFEGVDLAEQVAVTV